MYRVIARAQLRTGMNAAAMESIKQEASAPKGPIQRLLGNGDMITAACFKWQQQLFLYCESNGNQIQPDWLLPELSPYLEDWPGQEELRKWVPMIDIFHFNASPDDKHRHHKEQAQSRIGAVAFLKPEMAASYIYDHCLLQKERASDKTNKEVIGMHEHLLFSYREYPAGVEEQAEPGHEWKSSFEHLSGWQSEVYFQPWEDGHLDFKPIDKLFAFYWSDFLENK